MARMTIHADLKEFLNLLNSNKVRYLVVGGYAVIYYGWVPSRPLSVRGKNRFQRVVE